MSFFNGLFSGFGDAPRGKGLIDTALAPRKETNAFALSDSVGVQGRNKPDDVKKMETGLGGLGFMKKTKPTGLFGEPLKQGMQSFQQANGLAVDGQANVNGPTATALGQQVKDGNDFHAEQTKRIKAFGEEKEKQKKEADRQAVQAARTKAAAQAAAQAKPPQPWWKSKDLPEVSGEDYQSNRRMMDAMLKYADNGDIPNLQVQALRDYGQRAKAEFADYMQQLHERDPKRARGYEKDVFDKLDDDHKAKHFPEVSGGTLKSGTAKEEAKAKANIDASQNQTGKLKPLVDIREEQRGEFQLNESQPKNKHPKEVQVASSNKNDAFRLQAQKASSDGGRTGDKAADNIEWNDRPESHQFRNRKIFRVDGSIKVRHSANTLGPDGVRYGVKWYPLGKDGKRRAVVEKPNNQGEEVPSVARQFSPQDTVIDPPWGNSHGWEVELWIPPQESTHGNSGGHSLDVFLPKTKKPVRGK